MRIPGFHKKSFEERRELVSSMANMEKDDWERIGSQKISEIERVIENVIGCAHIPFSVATNFKINGKEMLVPMAIEEPSVVAAASNAAKMCLPEGFRAEYSGSVMIGQVQFVEFRKGSLKRFYEKKGSLMEEFRKYDEDIRRYGGGIRDITARKLDTFRGEMAIVEFYIDVSDAMGANTINTILEKSTPSLSEIFGEDYRMRILTNLALERTATARAVWKKETIGEETIERVLDGYAFACHDIKRCVTNNKGAMNGIDAVAIAFGQDFRAIEAGCHGFAAMNGYKPLANYWKDKDGNLVGSITIPAPVGTVGGAVRSLPHPKTAMKISGIRRASELAEIMACVGLANNFAAIRALCTEGIQKGHMKLHARNIAISIGAKGEDVDRVSEMMNKSGTYTTEFAKKALEEIRKK